MPSPVRVCVTGAAGQIAYSLLYNIAKGDVFGPQQEVVLSLLDIEPMMSVLQGVVMELDDCAFPLLKEVVATFDPEVAFKDCDAAILVGAMPRKEGMERKDLLAANVKIFKVQGMALDKVAKKSVKVLVVGNPANTNCLVTSVYAPSIPKSQFTCLTQLDLNRARALLAQRLKVSPSQVHDVIIWGNHSATQYPDVQHAYVVNADGSKVGIPEAIHDDAFLKTEFIKTVQTRGAAVIKARKLSSAMSAAKAIGDHMHSWWCGTEGDDFVSMGVITDGSCYSIKEGFVYSMPVRIRDHKISVVTDLKIDDFSRKMMDATLDELSEEREQAMAVVQAN
eukprot:m.60867 g.60867  ORF g.60867 m.60867 type:complete len:336 (+) comp13692_c0_seq1:403-1410(+)